MEYASWAMVSGQAATLKRLPLIGLFVFRFAFSLTAQTLPSALATPKQIREMLVQRIDVEHRATGIVVGVISKRGREIISYGKFDSDDPRIPDGETIFEIGSVTKVFTALLLSDMALKGEVNLNDPVSNYLPASVHMPTRNGKQITLLDLATHYSGLPREPAHSNLSYTVEDMYDFLNHHQLTRDPGAKYEYSNFGVALLGQVLARRAGTDYETLLRTRITGPLGMNHTAVHLTANMQAHLIPGHSGGRKTPSGPPHALAPAGAIRSNVDDIFIFLAANMGLIDTPLLPAMRNMLSVRRPAGPGTQIALAWHIIHGQNELVCHNGSTLGYHAFIGFERHHKVGVVVLSNSNDSIDDIADRVLQYPIAAPTELE
jgi:serine-type D-Ala-D-Ala carboxypeptidase/endopeptidase